LLGLRSFDLVGEVGLVAIASPVRHGIAAVD
jgi:hypothetical protein